jgi:hypothetical protein
MMEEIKREVVIDTDYFKKFTEKCPSGELFLRIMDEMNVSPVMHSYVYTEELMDNRTAIELVEKNEIKIYNYSNFIDENNINDYEDKFKRAYKDFNFKEFDRNIYEYRHDKESLGEIRSTLMAWYMNINIFMSDDREAELFVTGKLSNHRRKIIVYNVYDTLKEISLKSTKNIRWSDVKATAKFATYYEPGT